MVNILDIWTAGIVVNILDIWTVDIVVNILDIRTAGIVVKILHIYMRKVVASNLDEAPALLADLCGFSQLLQETVGI